MASGSQGGDAHLTIGDRACQWWLVTVTSIAATRSGGSLATPLLRNEEGILHPLQLLHLRIAIVVNACHGDCQREQAALGQGSECQVRAHVSQMPSESVPGQSRSFDRAPQSRTSRTASATPIETLVR
jgi:hypothetical protein